jgi:hypothetical protein
MSTRRVLLVGFLGFAALATMRCNAADASLCTPIADPAARLICYDAALRPVPPGVSAAAVQQPAAATSAAPAPAAKSAGILSAFGLSSKPGKHAEERASLKAGVTDVQMRASGQLVTLDNEQVWQITEYLRDPFVKVHDAIVIDPASMGSFLMSRASGGGVVRVRRLR